MEINVQSEIGKLNGVIVHTPGDEIENMTPENAERALYSDILNLAVASREYSQFINVLKLQTQTFEVKDLLKTVLDNKDSKNLFFNDFDIEIKKNDEYKLTAVGYGEKFDQKRHDSKHDVKSCTYHKLEVRKINRKNKNYKSWRAQVVLDI